MKVWTSKYRSHWVSPYRIAERLCFWREIDYDEPWVKALNRITEPACQALQWFLDKIHPRIVYVKIDYWDVWSFDHTLADIILPGLKKLREVKHGSPMVDEEDVPVHLQSSAFKKAKKRKPKHASDPNIHAVDTDNDDTIHERWDWVLNEIIWAFEQKADDTSEDKFFDHSESTGLPWDENYKGPKYDVTGHHAWQARKSNGFRLFGRYFECLWD